MKYIRGTLAVIIGALFMTGTSMIVVSRLFSEGPVELDQKTVVMACIGLGLGAAVGGVLCTFIVGKPNSPAIYVSIGVMIAVMVRNYAQQVGVEPDWFKILGAVSLAVGFLVGASAAAYKLDAR